MIICLYINPVIKRTWETFTYSLYFNSQYNGWEILILVHLKNHSHCPHHHQPWVFTFFIIDSAGWDNIPRSSLTPPQHCTWWVLHFHIIYHSNPSTMHKSHCFTFAENESLCSRIGITKIQAMWWVLHIGMLSKHRSGGLVFKSGFATWFYHYTLVGTRVERFMWLLFLVGSFYSCLTQLG